MLGVITEEDRGFFDRSKSSEDGCLGLHQDFSAIAWMQDSQGRSVPTLSYLGQNSTLGRKPYGATRKEICECSKHTLFIE